MTPMMKREFDIFPMPTCEKCHNKTFTGAWCVGCNLYTQSSERPIVFEKDTTWLEFACKKCDHRADGKNVIVASTCHACEGRIVVSGNKTLYGPPTCGRNKGHCF